MKIKISDTLAVEYLNGYHVVLTHKVQPPEHKDAGKTFYYNPKTYAKLETALAYAITLGYSEVQVKKGFEESYQGYLISKAKKCKIGE